MMPAATTTTARPPAPGLGDIFFNSADTRLVGTRAATSRLDCVVELPGGMLAGAPRPLTVGTVRHCAPLFLRAPDARPSDRLHTHRTMRGTVMLSCVFPEHP